MRPGIVAIIGRPNVGKSALFNRFLGSRKVIVEATPGVTRDRVYGELTWNGSQIKLIDTAGIDQGEGNIKKQMLIQVGVAIEEAELILFVCDATAGITVLDRESADFIRSKNKKVLLVVNKVDNAKRQENIEDFFQLGFGIPHPVSALHGIGIGEILDQIINNISQVQKEEFLGPKFAIIGRPNVGKSSYLNALLNNERVVVDDKPGTTRDAVDTVLKDGDNTILLIDTAGIRHKSRLKESLEFYSVLRSQEAIMRADVCLVIIDAYQGLAVDDVRILSFAWENNKPVVLVVNKWDKISNLTKNEYQVLIKKRIRFVESFPITFCSSTKKDNILEPMELARHLYEKSKTRIATSRLNEFLRNLVKRMPPPSTGGKRPNFLYITQLNSAYPAFKIFVNRQNKIKESYINYLKKQLSLEFNMDGLPIKLIFQAKKKG